MFSLIITSLFALATLANPIALESRATPDCATILSGFLAANEAGILKTFTLSSKNQVSYLGNGKNPLAVEFQECQSLEVGVPHDTQKSGRILVTSQNKCIAITNQANAVGPYYTTLATCDTAFHERWVVDTANNNAIRWSGESDEEGTILQGGCGLLGYKSNNGVPIITHSNHQITLECSSSSPFYLTSTPK